MATNFDYYEMRIKNVRHVVETERDFYLNNPEINDVSIILEYATYLTSRIQSDRIETEEIVRYDAKGNRSDIKKMNIDNHAISINILVYSKPWIRLKEFHKVVKLKEFVDGLVYEPRKSKPLDEVKVAANREALKKQLISGIGEKRYGKNKTEIDYDVVGMRIRSIDGVVYRRKKCEYRIEWD